MCDLLSDVKVFVPHPPSESRQLSGSGTNHPTSEQFLPYDERPKMR
jgi:hypothetical protein